jgi:hypothetical protein
MTQGVGSVPGTLISWAAGVIGVPASVVRAQINEESGGNPQALSPTGAQGVAQFEPGTWQDEGCSGSPNNVSDAMKCYAKTMYQLVKQFHGNVRDALAAYNAGPGNLQAGYGYADTILADAGQNSGLSASGGTGKANLDSASGGPVLSGNGSGCLVGGSNIDLKVTSVTFPCLLSATGVRVIVGGLCLTAAGIMGLAAMVILAASAFNHPRATAAVAAVKPVRSVVSAVTP